MGLHAELTSKGRSGRQARMARGGQPSTNVSAKARPTSARATGQASFARGGGVNLGIARIANDGKKGNQKASNRSLF